LHEKKQAIDKKAYRRVNSTIALGAFIMIGEFMFITTGTYAYFCWDVMEPITYLMMTGNMTIAFAYYTLKGRELEQESLQESWFYSVARKLYKRHDFDLDQYLETERDVKELRQLIKNSV